LSEKICGASNQHSISEEFSMRFATKHLLVLGIAFFLAACAPKEAVDTVGAAERPASGDRETLRPDGSAIHWRIDRRGVVGPQGIVVLAQGSGCLPSSSNENITRFRALAPHHAVLTVEKYGVSHGADTAASSGQREAGDCPPDYFKGHTVSQRADDYQRVIAALSREPWWNGQIVLFGGSEGGAAVAVLAPRLAKLDAVIIMSTGTGIAMADWIKGVLPPPVAAQTDAVFARIRANPNSVEVWGGNSWKWWADILDRVLADDLLKVKAPILLIHGELDQFAPVASARATRDRFNAAGHKNLTYREKSGLDHFMSDSAGRSHLGDVLSEANGWLKASAAMPKP
jgi:pimeloyl-ACP methyl ester carboxylesterase